MVDKDKSYWTFKDTSPSDYELVFYIKNHEKLKGEFFNRIFNQAIVSMHAKGPTVFANAPEIIDRFEIDQIYLKLIMVKLHSDIKKVITEVTGKYPIAIRTYNLTKGTVHRAENGKDWEIDLTVGGIYGRR